MSTEQLLLGIEIGGTKLQAVTGFADGRIERRWRRAVDPLKGRAGICQQLQEILIQVMASAEPGAIGVGFGGPIDRQQGTVSRSHQLGGWEGFPLRNWLCEIANGIPVVIENDANTAALAEAVCGGGCNANPVFYVTLGSGVGGGLIIDGKIYRGLAPGEAEFGHLRLDRDGTLVEQRCSGWAVDRRIRTACAQNPAGPLARLVGDSRGAESRHLASALAAGDPDARVILDSVADDLAFALSHVVHLFHPERIILGGGLSLVGQPLYSAVSRAMDQYIMPAFAPAPPVRGAQLAEDVVTIGALLLTSNSRCTT